MRTNLCNIYMYAYQSLHANVLTAFALFSIKREWIHFGFFCGNHTSRGWYRHLPQTPSVTLNHYSPTPPPGTSVLDVSFQSDIVMLLSSSVLFPLLLVMLCFSMCRRLLSMDKNTNFPTTPVLAADA